MAKPDTKDEKVVGRTATGSLIVVRGPASRPSTLGGLDLGALSQTERAQLALLCANAMKEAEKHENWHEATVYANDLQLLRAMNAAGARMGKQS